MPDNRYRNLRNIRHAFRDKPAGGNAVFVGRLREGGVAIFSVVGGTTTLAGVPYWTTNDFKRVAFIHGSEVAEMSAADAIAYAETQVAIANLLRASQ